MKPLRNAEHMNVTGQPHDGDEYELPPVETEDAAHDAGHAHLLDSDQLADEAPRDLSDVPDGPPPSDKVDFENLPEFVWQRQMLKTVRIVAVFVSIIIAIVLIVVFVGSGKGAKDSLKSVIDGEQPVQEQKP